MAFEPTEGLKMKFNLVMLVGRMNELMFSLIQNQEILDGLEVKGNAKFKKVSIYLLLERLTQK